MMFPQHFYIIQNSMCSDCCLEHHHGHELIKISTQMREKQTNAVNQIHQFAETARNQLSEIEQFNRKLVDTLNIIHDVR